MENKISILLADDNAEFIELFSEYLAKQPGFEVKGTARNGLDAYERIIEQDPDVVLLDIIMPKLDGLELLKRLNANKTGKMPVVMVLSAVGEEKVTREALRLGAAYYIIKPFDLKIVVKRIRTFCGLRDECESPLPSGPEEYTYGQGKELEVRAADFLLQMGIPPSVQGFRFIKDCAVLLCIGGEYSFKTHYLYGRVADQYHTTPVCVERAIHYAKVLAYEKNCACMDVILSDCGIKKNKGFPSNLELIRAVSYKIMK